ncbi:MAG: OmpA family protein [Methylobacter sp.]|nr:OmpA family protein [Methylobacter sp.]
MKKQLLFCLLGGIGLSQITLADEINFGKKTPSASQVIEALTPGKSNPDVSPEDSDYEGDIKHGAKTRSIDMSGLKATPKSSTPKTLLKAATETALSMEIVFGYNSAELTNEAKEQLKPVGEALASGKLSNLGFVVEGHTDAVGGQSYNKTLSEQRAASVKYFLVNSFNINSSAIQIVGKGKSDLLDPSHPDSEVNRRVRIISRK